MSPIKYTESSMHYPLYGPLLLTSVAEGISPCSKAKEMILYARRLEIESRSQQNIYVYL